jgi:hypothetical protein
MPQTSPGGGRLARSLTCSEVQLSGYSAGVQEFFRLERHGLQKECAYLFEVKARIVFERQTMNQRRALLESVAQPTAKQLIVLGRRRSFFADDSVAPF